MPRISRILGILLMPAALLLAGCNITVTKTSDSAVDWVTVRDYGINPVKETVIRLTTSNEYILRYGDRRDNTLRHPLVYDYYTRETATNLYGRFLSGDVDTRYGDATVFRYEDYENQHIYIDLVTFEKYADAYGDVMLETGGEKFFSIPSGRHNYNYTGTNIFAAWTDPDNTWGSGHSDGTFEMTVDFGAGTGSIVSGDSAPVPVRDSDVGLDGSEISGGFGVNTEKGIFSGNQIVVRNSRTRKPYTAKINGSFHGEGAGGMTAIYVESRNEPRFFGALAGVRTRR